MHDRYENPLQKRYAGREMQEIFSDDRKFSTWRKLWVALAESEKELGLDITDEQIAEMRAHIYDIDYEVADRREHEVRHDVMAHIYAFGEVCPAAKPPRCDKLFCGRQHRCNYSARCAFENKVAAFKSHFGALRFCRKIQFPAHPRIHPFSGSATHDIRKACRTVAAGSCYGS